jgi:signal transduction histidine kinase
MAPAFPKPIATACSTRSCSWMSRRKSGYGLGLAIVKRIVDWHGGKVTVYTCGLGGAGFAVTWGDDHRNRAGNASLNG